MIDVEGPAVLGDGGLGPGVGGSRERCLYGERTDVEQVLGIQKCHNVAIG